MRLQRAAPAEVPEVVALMNLAFRGAGGKASWNTEAAYIDGDRTSEALLEAEIAARPDADLLVVRAEHTGVIEACVWLEPAGAGVWYLGSLTIDPRLQNAGSGRRLLEEAERRVRDSGGQTIRMKVINLRHTLIAWYVRRGYRLTGEVDPFPYGDTRFGVPKRDDLSFVVLEKTLQKQAGIHSSR